jgi:DNA-binding transcriptional MocR family regulator
VPKVETFQDLVLEPRKNGQEMWRWLYTELRSAIIDGRLKSGARLPSTRNLAAQYGLARGTVVAAFQQLQAEGFVSSEVTGSPRHSLRHRNSLPAHEHSFRAALYWTFLFRALTV